MSTRSLGGAYYFAIYKDDCTSYRIVHCLTHKSDIQHTLPQVIQQIQQETSFLVQTIRSDRGTEFINREVI
jgi:IS30 family transposase